MRQKLEMSQSEFGAVFDTSPETIKSIENGRLDMGPRLANAIAEKSGIDLLAMTYLWGLRKTSGDAIEELFRKDWKIVFEEERKLEELTKEKFNKRSSRGDPGTADELIEDIRPHLLAAYQVGACRRGDLARIKREIIRTLMRTISEIWTETMDVQPGDLPDKK